MTKKTIFAVDRCDPETGIGTMEDFELIISNDVIEPRYQRIENGAGFEITASWPDGTKKRWYCEAVSWL